MLEQIVESCQFLLQNYPGAKSTKSYLDNRLQQSSQDLFQFGYFPNMENIQVLVDLVGEEELLNQKLLYYSTLEDSLFPRKLAFCYFENHPLIMPFRDPYGNILGLVCRSLFSDQELKLKKAPKYKNTKVYLDKEGSCRKFEKGHCVFGLYENKEHIIRQNSVYIVEGQFDVIKAMEIGFRNIVAIGNNNITSYQMSVITRYTNNIFMLLDNDEAGEKGRTNTIKKFGHLVNIRNMFIPNEYKDIDAYISEEKITNFTDISFIVKD
jgi:DNA primase catalytic core